MFGVLLLLRERVCSTCVFVTKSRITFLIFLMNDLRGDKDAPNNAVTEGFRK